MSPWLWAIWSRARNRTRLAELGLVDVRGVKLSLARKVWHPVRSIRVLSWAAWAGVTDPAEAVAGWSGSLPEAPSTPVEALETPENRKARIVALRESEPTLSTEEIGKRVGVSGRRVRQILSA